MKRNIPFLISFLFFQASLNAQNTLKDTVKINAVSIESKLQQEQLHQLDSIDLNNPQHLNLGDLLAKKSHLFVKSYGIGSLATVSLRGSGSSHTQLYWNGISINSSMNGSSDLSLFPLFFMDQVKLNYGLKSITDGTGGIGGAINFSSKPSFKKQQQVEFSSIFGSFGQRQYTGKFVVGNTKIQSQTKLYFNEAENNFNYKDLTQEGFPDREVRNASLEQKGLLQSLYYRPKESLLLEAQIWFFDSKRNLPPLITLRENSEFQEDRSTRAIVGFHKYWEGSKLSVKTSFLNDVLSYKNERASVNTKSETKSYRSRVDYVLDVSKKVNVT
ncbi:MAG: TonB-dependent receptor plug domain-containing protein, partial [Flavobacteriales bacterium]|nr:TonB-dependent receptor plug domain-containing protein [Flavobacteriales bacterium]